MRAAGGPRILEISVDTDAGDAGNSGVRSSIVPGAVALGAALFLVRMLGAPWPHFPPSFPDSHSYLSLARIGPLHPSFFFGERPIGYPLLAWVLGRSSTLVVVAQSLLYVGAFVVLGWVLDREISSRLVAFVAIVCIVAIAIEPRNSLWNTQILSESLSNTTAILMIAAWLRAVGRPDPTAIRWACIATIAWISVRDPNVIPAMLTVVPAAVAIGFVVRHRERPLARALLSGALSITLVCTYVYTSEASSHRGIYPVLDNVGTRILPDPSLTKWFVSAGMPMSDALRERTGHVAWDDNNAFLVAPQLAGIRSWAKGSGGGILLVSLVARAPDWWRRLHAALPHLLSYGDADYDTFGVTHRLPTRMPAPLGEPRTNGALAAGLLLAAAGIAFAATDRRRRLVAVATGVMLVSALADLYVSFAGDSIEVERHLVGPLLRLSVAMVVAIAIGVDTAVQSVRRLPARSPKVTVDG